MSAAATAPTISCGTAGAAAGTARTVDRAGEAQSAIVEREIRGIERLKATYGIMKKEAQRADREIQVSAAVGSIVTPFALAALGIVSSDLYKWSAPGCLLIWAVLILLHVAFWFRRQPTNRSLVSLYHRTEVLEGEAERLKKDLDELEDAIRLASVRTTYTLTTRRMLVEYAKSGIYSSGDIGQCFDELLAPLYQEGEFLFGFGGDEKWNFAVYLYSQDSDLLVPVWRQKARNHPSQGGGRTWGRGEGHVGKAFVDRRPIITSDAQHPEAATLSAAPVTSQKPYDNAAYRSFATFPIGWAGPEGSDLPLGVLVATSDRAGRFDGENTAILLHAADIIAATIQLTDISVDKLNAGESASVRIGA